MNHVRRLERNTAARDVHAGSEASGAGPVGVVDAITRALVLGAAVIGSGVAVAQQMAAPATAGQAPGVVQTATMARPAVDPAPEAVATPADGPVLRTSLGQGGGASSWCDDHVTIRGGTVRSVLAAAFRVNPSDVQFQTDEPRELFDVDLAGTNWPEVLHEALKRETGFAGTLETQRLPAYALRSDGTSPHRFGPGLTKRVYGRSRAWRDYQVDRLATPIINSDRLAALLGVWLGHRVVNQTELMGTYEVDMALPEAFHLSPDELDAFVQSERAVCDADAAAFASAVRSELGLDLVSIEGGHAFDVLVVSKVGASDVEASVAAAPAARR